MTNYSTDVKIAAPFSKESFLHRKNFVGNYMGVEIATNNLGFRDRSINEKAELNNRIWALGDSLTLGWGVDYEKSFIRLVEEGSQQKIINMGHGNYNLKRYRLLLENLVSRGFKAKEVWVFFFINDAEVLKDFELPELYFKSNLLKIILTTFMPLYWNLVGSKKSNFLKYYSQFYRVDSEAWKSFRKEVKKISKIASQNNMKIRAFLLPDLHRLENYPFQKIHQQVTSTFKSFEIETVDLLSYFESFKGREKLLWVAPDDSHPNALANKLISKGILGNL